MARESPSGPARDSGEWCTLRTVFDGCESSTMSIDGHDRGMGRRTRRPRQEAFKDDLLTEVKRVQEDHPKASVKLWAMDEHRVGLKPILRRMWMPRTAFVVALVWPRYESVQLSAFVCPETGETWMTDHFKVNIVNFDEILERCALEHQVDALNRVVLVVDRAGWHTSKKIVLPEGVDLVFLPP